jgi:hypothetical protein
MFAAIISERTGAISKRVSSEEKKNSRYIITFE